MNSLVFHLGQLGDTLIALPAFRAVRRCYPNARLTLLSDRHVGKSYVPGADLLKGEGIFNAYESYPVDASAAGRWLRPLRMLALARKLRAASYDTLVYLLRTDRTPAQVRRDRRFFRAAGIEHFIGMEGFEAPRVATHPLPALQHEADALLARLARSGIPVAAPGQADMELRLGQEEESAVERWLAHLPGDGKRAWIGVGPGSKMQAKRWPVERFEAAVRSLIDAFDIWPVVFGGPEDREVAEAMLRSWGRGYNAAGALGLRASARALARCALYLGNDTGTMHLAAAAGVPCAAVFSARDWPGRWHPYGVGHKVFRTSIECEGCRLQSCGEKRCLDSIPSADVAGACAEILRERLAVLKAV